MICLLHFSLFLCLTTQLLSTPLPPVTPSATSLILILVAIMTPRVEFQAAQIYGALCETNEVGLYEFFIQ